METCWPPALAVPDELPPCEGLTELTPAPPLLTLLPPLLTLPEGVVPGSAVTEPPPALGVETSPPPGEDTLPPLPGSGVGPADDTLPPSPDGVVMGGVVVGPSDVGGSEVVVVGGSGEVVVGGSVVVTTGGSEGVIGASETEADCEGVEPDDPPGEEDVSAGEDMVKKDDWGVDNGEGRRRKEGMELRKANRRWGGGGGPCARYRGRATGASG